MVEVSWGQREQTGRRSWVQMAATAVVSLVVLVGAATLPHGLGWLDGRPSDDAPAPAAPVQEPRTIHVATDGDDAAAGSETDPKRTIKAAVRASNGGDTIEVQAGTYREELKVEDRPDLELVAAPGADVWLDGSVDVDEWVSDGEYWVSHGWHAEFDASPTYSWGAADHNRPGWSFINPEHPLAAHPDQVWLDGERQEQVGARSEVREGAFYVDYDRDELVLGSDPAGRSVTASALTRALRMRSAGMVIRDIGIRKYAPSVPHMGAVTVEAPDITLDGITVADNATTGVHVLSSGVRVQDVDLVRNGMMGLSATEADGLELVRVTARENNVERFNSSPASGGAKIGRSSDVLVRDSMFSGNHANGIWFDESVHGLSLVASRMVDNSGHGVSIELTGNAAVVGNLVARNGGNGLKLNDSEDVEVWNNTFVDNNRSINIVQDDRDLNPRGSFHDPELPLTWQTQNITVRNNVLARTHAASLPGNQARICLLCVEDYSGRWTAAEMDVTALGNVYQRPDSLSPKWIVVWSRRDKDPYVFPSVDDFRETVYQEGESAEFTGTPVLSEDLQPLPVLEGLYGSVAQPLPGDIAELVGRQAGEHHLGAWFSERKL